MNTATQPGADSNPDLSQSEVEVRQNPRDVAIDAMTARMEKARIDDLAEAVESDPGLRLQQESIENQIEESNQEAEREGLLVRDPVSDNIAEADGAASLEPMHPQPAPAEPKALPQDLEGDPLAEYIVMENGQPMFQTKVDGNVKLIPLDQARRELQIGTAAAVRMNEATAIKASLDQRDRELTAREAAHKVRIQQAQTTVPATPPADLSDEELLAEATEIFETAFTGSEEDAAKKLARTLGKIRTATVQAQPNINPQEIVAQAATTVMQTIRQDDHNKDVNQGYDDFKKNYPDLMTDPKLYKMADDMTDEIEKEHPEWPISQVMDEAGKRTRDWVNSLRGDQDTGDDPAPDPTPDPSIQPGSNQSTQTRQERKSQLVRMPHVAPAAIHQDDPEIEEGEQSPLEALSEIRKARGQPY